ncbi:sensor histidine kinase [Paenibacillus harenae]|uniref:Sensor histidine kinase YesM n=1 Tax=Paenibacillus harenae TaxID=306543 RepID=A0ABT9U3E6_PAEHA|nr:histidine kinase [Paenibacillus harenae]MDQ0113513.1 sensor histidine kinase YesM [Paenibacillus harenae]
MLQVQIKPHFLNNTLETIRMLAVSNNDKEVADISFWFGKLMRYSQRGRYRSLSLSANGSSPSTEAGRAWN